MDGVALLARSFLVFTVSHVKVTVSELRVKDSSD